MLTRACLVAGGVLLIAASLSFGSTDKRGGARHGEILCGDSSNAEIIRLDPKTGDTHLLSDDDRFVQPNDLAFDGPNKLYVSDYGAFVDNGGVFKVNPETGKTSVVSKDDQFEQPDGIAAAPNGKLWVTDLDAGPNSGTLFRVDPKTGKTKSIASSSSMTDALGVVVPGNGKPIVATGGSSAPLIARVNPKTGKLHTIAKESDGLDAANGLALFDGKLYTNEGNILQSVDVKTGRVKTAIDPYDTDTYGVTVDPRGRVYTGDSDDVIRGNPKTDNVDSVGSGFGFCEGLEYVR